MFILPISLSVELFWGLVFWFVYFLALTLFISKIDPSQLKGVLLRASLKKSTMGFGFTIIGGDRPDEFLQVKNVLKDGPAAQDGKIAPGNKLFRIT